MLSVVLLIPCFWHSHIEASDLASHTYNAWLASLIRQGQAPGLYFGRRQWTNLAVDVALDELGGIVGLAAAEKIVVSACVLIVFWGAFAFIRAYTGRAPWVLAPAIAMIAYGWTFYMGFFNYYLSVGLAFLAISLIWRGGRTKAFVGVALSVVAVFAHPMGLIWIIVATVYLKLADRLRGASRWALPVLTLLLLVALHFYVLRLRTEYWDTSYFYALNGGNQLALFGKGYWAVGIAVFAFGVIAFVVGVMRQWSNTSERWRFRSALELWILLLLCAALIPETLWVPMYSAPIGMIIARLTTITAVMGICVLASVPPRRWHLASLAVCAIAFFALMYRDTNVLNSMERSAEKMVRTLPKGRRVIATIWSPPDSSIFFTNHLVDRACIEWCFAYSNYEPSTGQFRIRARPGSAIAIADTDASGKMETGDYVVQASDLPVTQIYQCDGQDLTKLCMRDLQAGELNGRLGYRPPKD